jgi:dTDP-glucose 4,6-dehydratase
MENWLITGGAGFIGSNLVRCILARRPSVSVTVLDALTYAGHRESLAECEGSPRFRLVHGDVTDGARVAALFAEIRPAVVLHLAAESHVDRSIHGPAPFLRTNVDGTFQLLEAMRAAKTGRVVVVSTDEVYGSLGRAGRFAPDSRLDPSSPYSASKASADLIALAYHRTYGLDVLVTRCSNNYGPYQMPEKLIPLMIMSANEDRPLPVYGDGMNVRDWIYVEDHCKAILTAAEKGAGGHVYLFGGNSERTNLEVVRLILRKMQKPESLIRMVTDRPGHDRRYAVDTSQAEAELGFRPTTSLEEGIDLTIDWYLRNTAWCRLVAGESHREHMERNYAARLNT